MGRCSLLVWAVIPATVGGFGGGPLLLSPRTGFTRQHDTSSSPGADPYRRLLNTQQCNCNNSSRGKRAHHSATRQRASRWTPQLSSSVSDDDAQGVPPISDAAQKAEAALRKLSPEELEGMKPRLGLDDALQGEDIISQAVPILAAKIREREMAQAVGLSAARAAAEERADEEKKETAPAFPVQSEAVPEPVLRSPAEASRVDWAGGDGDGVERGWVGEKGSRRWVGAPGEKPPRQRHADREPEPPLAPGQRSYFATCPRCVNTPVQTHVQ